MIYSQEGDMARASLATAERNNLEGNPKMALTSARMAMRGIPKGSPDYLRAQDIAMVSCTELTTDSNGKDKKVNKELAARCNN
jgi:predicted Zn-dependent protease